MGAFNGRLGPKMWFGMPAASVISAFVALLCGALAMLFDTFVARLVLALIAGASGLIGIAFFVLGERVIWLPLQLAHRREARQHTLELGGELRE